MKVKNSNVIKLRQMTGVGVMECKKALEKAEGDLKKAQKILKKRGRVFVEKKQMRKTEAGVIETYLHPDHRTGVILELTCETDFVARNEIFKNLAHDLALQIAAMNPKDIKELLKQPFIRDESRSISDLITEAIQKTGENIVLKRFCRYEVE